MRPRSIGSHRAWPTIQCDQRPKSFEATNTVPSQGGPKSHNFCTSKASTSKPPSQGLSSFPKQQWANPLMGAIKHLLVFNTVSVVLIGDGLRVKERVGSKRAEMLDYESRPPSNSRTLLATSSSNSAVLLGSSWTTASFPTSTRTGLTRVPSGLKSGT